MTMLFSAVAVPLHELPLPVLYRSSTLESTVPHSSSPPPYGHAASNLDGERQANNCSGRARQTSGSRLICCARGPAPSVCVCVCVCVSLSLALALALAVSRAWVCGGVRLSVCLCVSLCVSMRLYVSLCLSVSLCVSLCLSLSRPFSLCVAVPLSISLPLSLPPPHTYTSPTFLPASCFFSRHLCARERGRKYVCVCVCVITCDYVRVRTCTAAPFLQRVLAVASAGRQARKTKYC